MDKEDERTPGLFRKKPVVIEAVQLKQRFLWPDWFHDAVSANTIITHGLGKYGTGEVYCEIKTLEGVMRANDGDWIIRGVKGEIYPCKPSIFSETYEPADSAPSCSFTSLREALQICDGLIGCQIREGVINSIDELKIIQRTVRAALNGVPASEPVSDCHQLREALANLCDEIDRHIDAAPSDRKPVFHGIAEARAALNATQPASDNTREEK